MMATNAISPNCFIFWQSVSLQIDVEEVKQETFSYAQVYTSHATVFQKMWLMHEFLISHHLPFINPNLFIIVDLIVS